MSWQGVMRSVDDDIGGHPDEGSRAEEVRVTALLRGKVPARRIEYGTDAADAQYVDLYLPDASERLLAGSD